MKKPIVLGNWKANKTLEEAQRWIEVYKQVANIVTKTTVVLCPGFIHLSLFNAAKLGIDLGVQDISQFSSGAYTGETCAGMIKDLARYALIGHSERRINLGETDRIVVDKVKQALENTITPVVCVSELTQAEFLVREVPGFSETGIWLYEPLDAISTGPVGKPQDPKLANEFASCLKVIAEDAQIIYGGSVSADNVSMYLSESGLSGIGVGGASLDPHQFASLVLAAEKY